MNRPSKVPGVIVVGAIAAVVTAAVFAIVRWRASTTIVTAGFRFHPGPYTLSAEPTRALGGPLTDSEIASIKAIARGELERAFAGTRMAIADDTNAFWHIEVRHTLGEGRQLPHAGHAIGLGPLGGVAEVSFTMLALSAIRLAPKDASRQTMIDGIGRGIGRAAVHELAHQIVATAAMDNSADPDSYEYGSFNRASQYYGELHWAGAWPLVLQKIGK
jgi:hypothetical protein